MNKKSKMKKIIKFSFYPILVFNYFAWIYTFDWDNKINYGSLFLIFNIVYYIYIKFLFYSKKEFKGLVKKTFFIIYFITSIEFFSYATIKLIIILHEPLSDRIKYALDDLDHQSKHISWMTSDLRSDYKPNIFSPLVNKYGYRLGGKKTPDDIFKIMCIGGSTTWGPTVRDSSSSYPGQLKKYLTTNGYNIEVVNAGVPYHTSLDVLMRLLTKGVYYKPDMALIHTGGNDIGPLASPYEYKPDYSHWRDVGYINRTNLFKKLWINMPLSSVRLFLIYFLKPGEGDKSSHQTTLNKEILASKTPINKTRTMGFENYFSTIIATLKHNNIIPVTILFNDQQTRLNSKSNEYFYGDELEYSIKRRGRAIKLHNSIMDSISILNEVKVIEFNKFEPSEESSWIDGSHLDSIGIKEKAEFIGQYLVKHFSLNKNN